MKKKDITRRDFLKTTVIAGTAGMVGVGGLFTSCTVPEKDRSAYIEMDRWLLMQDVCIIDTVQKDNLKIILRNPYRNKGGLELKGSMHNHTDNSAPYDGFGSGCPRATAIKFRDEGGYDFFTFTDHNFVTQNPEVSGIVWMGNALEDTKHTQHLVIYNLPAGYRFRNRGSNIHELTDYYLSLGAIVSLAHPCRSIRSDDKILSIKHLDFVEIVNSLQNHERTFDLLLSNGVNVFGLGVDDYHYQSHWEYPNHMFNKAFIIAFAEERERASIWKALLSGCFYAVTLDARMDISCNNGIINVSSSIPSTFEFLGLNTENPRRGLVLRSYESVKEASYTIQGNEGYVRVRMTNPAGKAFSQPFVILSVTKNNILEEK